MVLHDLQIPVRPFGFDSDKHAAPPSGHRNYAKLFPLLSGDKIAIALFCRHRIFPKTQSAPNNFNLLPPKIGVYCRTWVKVEIRRQEQKLCGVFPWQRRPQNHFLTVVAKAAA
jgi:hypothetical protein